MSPNFFLISYITINFYLTVSILLKHEGILKFSRVTVNLLRGVTYSTLRVTATPDDVGYVSAYVYIPGIPCVQRRVPSGCNTSKRRPHRTTDGGCACARYRRLFTFLNLNTISLILLFTIFHINIIK